MHLKLDDANGTAPTESLQTGSAEETNVKPVGSGSDGEDNNAAKDTSGTENDNQTEQEEEEEEILPDLGDDDDDDDDLDLPAPVSAV